MLKLLDPPPPTNAYAPTIVASAFRPTARPKIRVGFVVHVMQVAGAEMLVARMIRSLRDRIDATVFCLDDLGTLGEQLRAEGVEVVVLGRRPGRDYGVAWRLAREVRDRRIDIVHAHQYAPFFYSALARLASRKRFRLILTEHGRHYPDVVSPLRRGINRLVLDRCADAVNACCRFSANALSRVDGFAGNRIEVFENGIDLSKYSLAASRESLRAGLGLSASRRYIAMVARFHPVKDHAMLIRGFARIAAEYPDTDLLLVGDGERRAAMESQIAGAGLNDRVVLMGVRSDIPEILAAIDIFALTSASEAASLTLLEAMASGKPAVVTDVGGNPEIVREGIDGFLVPRGDDAALAGAFRRMLDDSRGAISMGEAGRKRVHQYYGLERTISRYFHLYRELLPN